MLAKQRLWFGSKFARSCYHQLDVFSSAVLEVNICELIIL